MTSSASSSSSSPTIPNLFTLRSTRGRGGLRRINDRNQQAPSTPANRDLPIQQTDQDASAARMSAVQMGYLEDEFAGCFLPAGNGDAKGSGERRMPIINRGTYVRTTTLDRLVSLFLSSPADPPTKQILSLGAGSDTRFFRLLTQTPQPRVVYHELDFAAVASRKVKTVAHDERLMRLVRTHAESMGGGSAEGNVEVDAERGSLYSAGYNIHPVDLRTLPAQPPPHQLRNLHPHLPTLIISECLLCYLPDPPALLAYLTSTTIPPPTPVGLVLYEPLSPPTFFSRTMTANLSLRGISLSLLPSLRAQLQRLADTGFATAAGAADVHFLWERWVAAQEKARVGRLEMLDEVEEWELIGRHYCVAWGWRGADDVDADGSSDTKDPKQPFNPWKDAPSQEP